MDKKTYFIYQCICIKDDETKIERIFKIPSFWEYSNIVPALLATIEKDNIASIKIESEDFLGEFKINESICTDATNFDELIDSNIIVSFKYNDGIISTFYCDKIAEEHNQKSIYRKTPILVSYNGYYRVTKNQYYEGKTKLHISLNMYEKEEVRDLSQLPKRLKINFNVLKDLYLD